MNMEEKSRKRMVLEAILGAVILAWSFYILDRGYYMDEHGLLSVYKGIYQGKRFFIDAWGPHQLGGIVTYPFFALYDLISSTIYPLGIGFVLYMRICYQVVRLLIAIYLYITIRRTEYKNAAFITALTYYMFFVSFKNISYKSMCEMGIMLFLCWAYRYFETRNKWFFMLMALATCVTILAYPTMIVFPVIFVICMLVMSNKGYELLRPTIIYIVTCFVCGIAVVIYILLTSGLGNVLSQIQYTGDHAYPYPLYIRIGIMLLSYVFFFVVAYAPIVVIKIVGHFRYISEKTTGTILSIYWIVFMAAILLLRPESISTTRYIYGCLIIFFWYPFFRTRAEKNEFTQIGSHRLPEYEIERIGGFILFISIVVQFIWAMTTNQEVTVPGHLSIYVILAVLLIAEKDEKGIRVLRAVFVLATIFFMGFWVAESDGGYNDILEHRTYVADGAYRGMALDDADYKMNQSTYNLLSTYVSPEDKLYCVNGYGGTGYLNSDAFAANGSPFSRVGVGQLRVLQYWEVNPENQPDYILIDTTNKYYEEYLSAETAQYINENYTTTVATDGAVVLLTR